ncbi:MAG: histidinol-phosphate transaminase [Hydrogenibacillus sp.]|nr:histidinol-phosphate transaminase [Hydrogenibacillus sp.]
MIVRMMPMDAPIYEPGKPIADLQATYGLADVVKLASNENPYGPSPRVREALAEALQADGAEALWRYPDGAARALRRSLADRYGLSVEQVAIGAGADELIQMIALRFLYGGGVSVMAETTFPMYLIATRIAGGTPRLVPMAEDGGVDLAAHAASVDEATRIVWLANPNNPTGMMFGRQAWEGFLSRVPDDVLVVLDEAYAEFVTDADYPDGPRWIARHPNVVVLRTFSKAYGLAGLRVGYALGAPEIIAELERVRKPFNTSTLAQRAAAVALTDEAHVAFVREANLKAREALAEALLARGLRPFPSQTNFLYVPGVDGRRLAASLEPHGVIVRPAPGGVRISVGTESENARLLKALDALMADPEAAAAALGANHAADVMGAERSHEA